MEGTKSNTPSSKDEPSSDPKNGIDPQNLPSSSSSSNPSTGSSHADTSANHSGDAGAVATVPTKQAGETPETTDGENAATVETTTNKENPSTTNDQLTTSEEKANASSSSASAEKNPTDHENVPIELPMLPTDSCVQKETTRNDSTAQQNDNPTTIPLLPRDTFSFLLLFGLSGHFWALVCGIITVVIQSMALTFLLLDNANIDQTGNPFGVPANVSNDVRASQFLAIMIAVFSQDNVTTSVQSWSHGIDKFRTVYPKLRGDTDISSELEPLTIAETGQVDATVPIPTSKSLWLIWHLSILCRFMIGWYTLVATFILIMVSETSLDVLLNFLAVEFVCSLDNIMFELSNNGFFGENLRNDTKTIEAAEIDEETTHPPQTVIKGCVRYATIPIIAAYSGFLWIWLSSKQARGEFLCDTIFVQFGDELAPNLGYFSGLYKKEDVSKQFGDRVEYIELGHSGRSTDTNRSFVPARFGYVDNSWVFYHGKSAQDLPIQSDWAARSTETITYDITTIAPSDWIAKIGATQAPLQFFHLSCYDCKNDEDFCGGPERGKCVDNRCDCEGAYYGLRCEFARSHEALVVDVQSMPFPEETNPALQFSWPSRYEMMEGIKVYDRPVYLGTSEVLNGSLAIRDSGRQNFLIGVHLFFTGRRWAISRSLYTAEGEEAVREHAINDTVSFFTTDFHAFWSTFDARFVSDPSDVNTGSHAVTPSGFSWYDSQGTYLIPTDAVLVTPVFTFNNLRKAVEQFETDSVTIENVYGAINDWDVSGVTDMSGLFSGFESFDSDISSWNMSRVTTTAGMFYEATSFNQTISEWDVSSVTNMQAMFYMAESFNNDVSSWNVSAVTDMSSMFESTWFDQDISKWDTTSVTTMRKMFQDTPIEQNLSSWSTSSVTDMSGMFAYSDFDNDISDWDTSKVTNMADMFRGSFFNQDISKWNTGQVTDMSSMFNYDANFTQDLSTWNTSSVRDMGLMFSDAYAFNGDVSSWDTSNVVYMNGMFSTAESFNGDISAWDTSKVFDMGLMFSGANAFNSDVSSWDTSNVEDMNGMFSKAKLFNGDISAWDTSKVTNMGYMFNGYDEGLGVLRQSVFDQDLSGWDTSSVEWFGSMFRGSAFNHPLSAWNVSSARSMTSMFEDASNFDQDLSSWDVSSVTSMVDMFRNAVAFNQTICWRNLHPNVTVTGMFCDTEGSFDPECVSAEIIDASEQC